MRTTRSAASASLVRPLSPSKLQSGSPKSTTQTKARASAPKKENQPAKRPRQPEPSSSPEPESERAVVEQPERDPSETDCDEPAMPSLPTPRVTPTKRVKHAPVASTSRLARPVTSPPRTVNNVFQHAQALLTTASTSADHSFLGRTHERNTLVAFLDDRFPGVFPVAEHPVQTRAPSLYVSGPPGIGKTALLSSVLADFVRAVDESDQAGDVVVHMENCSSIGSVALEASMWERLCKGLDMPLGKLKGRERFEAGLNSGRKFLIVLDEIDHILAAPRSQGFTSRDLLHTLFALAHAPDSSLTLIGIANALDLTARSLRLPSSTSSSPSPKGKGRDKVVHTAQDTPIVLPFKPYRAQDLASIVTHRLAGLADSYPCTLDSPWPTCDPTAPPNLVDPRALELCAKRVASGTGDVRTVLSIVAKAIAIVERDERRKGLALSPSPSTADSLAHLTPNATRRVSIPDMMAALRASGLSAPEALTSRLAPLQFNVRNALVGIAVGLSRQTLDGFEAKGPLSVRLNEAFEVYKEVVRGEGTLPTTLSKMEFLGALEPLEGAALLAVATAQSSPPKKQQRTTHGSAVSDPLLSLNPAMTLADLVEALRTTPAASCELAVGAGAMQETLRISSAILAREEKRVRGKKMQKKLDDMAPSEGFHGSGLDGGSQRWIGAKGKRPRRDDAADDDDEPL